MSKIRKLLIANRGEIARRIQRTCRSLGVRTVAVFSEADAGLPFVAEADEAVCIGPAAASGSYLNVPAILAAAARTGADAVHPGYGFLAENAAFAQAVEDAGLVWVGPPGAVIAQMGDKAAARRLAVQHGVPVVPGYDGQDQADATLCVQAEQVGVPLLVKAAAGGGGRGMRRVDDLAQLPDALAAARREALGAFGDDTLLLERYVTRPRHVEVQVLADAHGQVVHLGARDCSIQRRHQKIVEESPPPNLPEATHQGLLAAAVRLTAAVGYVGAGTVEFIVDADGGYYFLEMNTRLQVEHPVTEAVWDVDLVALQLAVAEGTPLELWDGVDGAALSGTTVGGHAVEVRIYAEDPNRGWLPVAGTLVRAWFGDPDLVRIDAGYGAGDVVSPHYDSMIAKVVAWGADRGEALRRLSTALDDAWVPGLVTNLPLLREVLRDAAFVDGDVHTGFLSEHGYPRTPPANLARGARVAAAWAASQRMLEDQDPVGWRIGGPAEVVDTWAYLDEDVEVGVRRQGAGWLVRVADAEPVVMSVQPLEDDTWRVTEDGYARNVRVARLEGPGEVADGDTLFVHLGDGEAMVRLVPRFPAPRGAEVEPGSCVAPTPGVVRAVHVAVGARVAPGDPLITLEAMKMEHTLKAPVAGEVLAVRCAPGDAVDGGALLVKLEADDG